MCLGVVRTVHAMVPLLQGPHINPHATLITLFMNAVIETLNETQSEMPSLMHMPTLHRVLSYLPLQELPVNQYHPNVIKLRVADDKLRIFDNIFDL